MKNAKEFEALKALVDSNFAMLEDGRTVYMTPTGEVRDMDTRLLLPADPIRAALYLKNKDKSTGTGLPSDVGPYKQMATDGEGKWVPVDRLAYKTFEPATITLDGNTDGLETLENAYFKISNQTISKSQLLGQTVTFLNSGESIEIAIDETNTIEIAGNVAIQFEGGTALVYSIKTPMEGFTEGLWFFCVSSDIRVSELTFLSEIAHPIPEEYIPERKTYPVTEETVDGVEKWVCGLDFATACNMSPESLRESLTYRAVQDNPIECAKINSRHGQYWILHFHPMSVNSTTNVLSEETVYLKWDENGITEVTTA